MVASRAVNVRESIFAAACIVTLLGCGGTPANHETSAHAADVGDAGMTTAKETTPAAVDAGDGRPFAGTNADATDLISRAVDQRHAEISKCTQAFRLRKKSPHEKIVLSLGIDQDGQLLGVTSRGREDAELKRCVQDAVKGAPFPRSHAGVITVTKTYEELVLQ